MKNDKNRASVSWICLANELVHIIKKMCTKFKENGTTNAMYIFCLLAWELYVHNIL